MPRIFVVGSLNADLVIASARLPAKGETLAGGDLRIFPGGKGANQAVAAAKLGAAVRMVGALGRDVFADLLLESLRVAGVDTALIERTERSTGAAQITVLPDGENAILLSPGANQDVSPQYVREALADLSADDFVLCQLEIPLDAVAAALECARERGAKAILDPAPAQPLDAALLSLAHIVTPNETEAIPLLGLAPREGVHSLDGIAGTIQQRSRGLVILKLGAKGCFFKLPEQPGILIEGFQVEAVDTTAAGDTFNAALAVSLSSGTDIGTAASFANAAAAVSVTRAGAQSSAPSLEEIEALLARA